MKLLKVKITMFNYALVDKNGDVEHISLSTRMTEEYKNAYKASGKKVVYLSSTKSTYQIPVDQFIEQATLCADDANKEEN